MDSIDLCVRECHECIKSTVDSYVIAPGKSNEIFIRPFVGGGRIDRSGEAATRVSFAGERRLTRRRYLKRVLPRLTFSAIVSEPRPEALMGIEVKSVIVAAGGVGGVGGVGDRPLIRV